MPFTSTGYDVRDFREILENVRLGLETNLGTPISSNPDSVIAIHNNVYSNEAAIVENNIQALVSNISIFTAEGRYLDELVYYIGIKRRGATAANGLLKVWRDGEGLVPSATLYKNSVDELFTIPGALQHNLDACAEILFDFGIVQDTFVYSFGLNSLLFTYTAGPSDTAPDVAGFFVTDIFNRLGITATNESGQLRITADEEDLNALSANILTNITLKEIAVFATTEAVIPGELTVAVNTITTIVTNNPALLRVNNPLPFTSGVPQETDEELRARHQESIQLGGNATVPAITAKLKNINNVTQAYIIENRTLVDDVDGRPGKSYECFVVGGDPQTIGQTIWDSKPAGVETVGDLTTNVTDALGTVHAVKWSRPEDVYIFIRVTYQLYNEEVFPATGEQAMSDALIEYGESLVIGKDVIPTRFIGPLYQAVNGVDTILVEVGFSTSIGDLTPPGGYVTTTIPIAASQVAQFTASRITLIQT